MAAVSQRGSHVLAIFAKASYNRLYVENHMFL